jgi:hypothetical protein
VVPQRRQLIASVMAELRGYIDAVDEFETAVGQHFGLTRRQLRSFLALRERDDVPIGELEGLSEVLEQLERDGHVRIADGMVQATPAARGVLDEAFAPVEAAETGLHRYAADELGIVRNFLRVGRQFYERRAQRFQSRT